MRPNPSNTHLPALLSPITAHRTPGHSRLHLTHPSGKTLGELRFLDSGAGLTLGDLHFTLERDDRFGYRMLAAKPIMSAEPVKGLEQLSIHHGERDYSARVSPLRNTAVARSEAGTEVARVSGGLLGLKYRLDFAATIPGPVPGSALVAVLLLAHLLVVRSRVYRAVPVHVPPGGL